MKPKTTKRAIALSPQNSNPPPLAGGGRGRGDARVSEHAVTGEGAASEPLAVREASATPRLAKAQPGRESGNSAPSGWQTKRLRDVARTGSGGTPKRDRLQYFGGPIPWVKSGELRDGLVHEAEESITQIGLESSSAKLFPKGTLCIALYGATVGRLGILNIEAATNQAVCGIFPSPKLETKYLFYFLYSRRQALVREAKGGAQPNISQEIIRELRVPIPPLDEQRRIVAELETQLTRLDASVTALKRVRANLKRYRASVLKAACEGRLVPTDCKFDTKVLAESNHAKEWEVVHLEAVADVVDPHPSHRTPPEYSGGIPYIGIGDVRADDTIDYKRARQVSHDLLNEHRERYCLQRGDFMVGKIGTIGRTVRLDPSRDFVISANVVLIQPKLDRAAPHFIQYCLDSPSTQGVFRSASRATTQAAFGIQRFRKLRIYLPPKVEQERIVAEVERRLSVIEEIESAVAANLKRAKRLKETILGEAFSTRVLAGQ